MEGGGDPEVGPEDDDDADLVDDGGDSSARRYPAKTMLLFLVQLHSMLKGGPIRTALVIAAQLLRVDPAPVRDPSQLKIPTRSTLQRATIRLDMVMIMWWRHQWSRVLVVASCLMADASMQAHVEFFGQRLEGF